MAKGSTGTNTGTIIYVKRRSRKARPSNCKSCSHSIWINSNQNLYCTVMGLTDVDKKVCTHYSNGDSFKTASPKHKHRKKKKARK